MKRAMFLSVVLAVSAFAAKTSGAGTAIDFTTPKNDSKALEELTVGEEIDVTWKQGEKNVFTVVSEMPSFGGGRSYTLSTKDGGGISTTLTVGAERIYMEHRDYATGRLYQAWMGDNTRGVEVTDLATIGHGSCGGSVEPDEDVQRAKARSTAASLNLHGAVTGNPFDDNIVSPAPARIDIMIVFDNRACEWVASSQKYSSITNFAIAQVAKMNSVLVGTGLHTNLWYRLVDVLTVDTTYKQVDNEILGIMKNGAESGEGPYGQIGARKEACGADVVSLMIDTGSAEGTTGIGYQTYGKNYAAWVGYRAWCYSCCAIRSVDVDYTLLHEVGHNMGLRHSTSLGDWTPKSNTLEYCNGYNFVGTNGVPYHTIMAYDRDRVRPDGFYWPVPYFSSPDYEFQGVKLGTAESNDCTRALRELCSAIGDWHRTVIPLPSEILFSPSSSEALHITLSNIGGYEIRYTLDGSDPTRESALYEGPIDLTSGSVTIKAVAVVDETTLGEIAEKTYSAAVELGEYVIVDDLSMDNDWRWADWRNPDGSYVSMTFWNTSSNKTAVVDVGGTLNVDREIGLATLFANAADGLTITASGSTLFATNLDVMGSATLAGPGFKFEKWRLHQNSTLLFAPGAGQTVILDKYLDLGAAGSTLAISNGTLSVTKGANSGDGISTLRNASVRVDNGGILSLDAGWISGYANTNPITVNKGGLLKMNELDSTTRPLVLNGGSVKINKTGRAYEMRAMKVSVHDDSTIKDVTSSGEASVYIMGGDATLAVDTGKTLAFDARITTSPGSSSTEGNGIHKTGGGEVRFLRELSHTGTNTISAGTFSIAYKASGANCAHWKVEKGATLKIENGCSLTVPSLGLAGGAVLSLPASASEPPLAVSDAVRLSGVKIELRGAENLSHGASYPLIRSSSSISGIAKIDTSAMPELEEGLAWKFTDNENILSAVVATKDEAAIPLQVVCVDDLLAAEIPNDATVAGHMVEISQKPILIEDINDTAVAFAIDVELPDTQSSSQRTLCSWTVNANVVRCVRDKDGYLDVFYSENSHKNNITNKVELLPGRHTVKVGYNYGEYGGTWVFVDEQPAYWSRDVKWSGGNVGTIAIGATADATPKYPYQGLIVYGAGVLTSNSTRPLPLMTGSEEISYNYLIANNSPTNTIPAVFPNTVGGGYSINDLLVSAAFPGSYDTLCVSMVASFPADEPGCLFGAWTRGSSSYAYTGQIDYDGQGGFSFSRNGYISSGYYTIENNPDKTVDKPHLYTLEYTINRGFCFYQDGELILSATWGFEDKDYHVYNRIDFGRGPWNNLTTSYNDNPNPMAHFKLYASHIAPGTNDRTESEAAVMASLNFAREYDGMTLAEKLAYLPAYQTADGVEAPKDIDDGLDEADYPARILADGERLPAVDVLVAFDAGAQDYVATKNLSLADFAQAQIDLMNSVLQTNRLDRWYTYRLAGVCRVDAAYSDINSTVGLIEGGEGPCVALRAAREMYSADTVTLLIKTSGEYLGHSSPLTATAGGDIARFHEDAFSVCNIQAVDENWQFTMMHENAHNMGCGHSRAQSSNPGPAGYAPYASGTYFALPDGSSRHTIMAYGNNPSWYFSTPYRLDGLKLGDATNDNNRVLRETSSGVAKWRDSVRPFDDDVQAVDANGNAIRSGRIFKDSITATFSAPMDGATLYYNFKGLNPSTDDDPWITNSPWTVTFNGDRNLTIAARSGGTMSPPRNIKFYKSSAIPSAGIWETCIKYPWYTDADGCLRSCNITDYTYQCTSALKATVEGPKRLSFSHKSYFGGVGTGGSNYSHFDVLLDDSPVIAQTESTNAWTTAAFDIPEGKHEVTFVFSLRFAMNNPQDYKDGSPEADDAVWLKDISLSDNVNPVLEIPKGQSLQLSNIPGYITTLTGEGTLLCGAALPKSTYGLPESPWKGTVVFEGLTEGDATKDFQFERFGNAGSAIRLVNCAISYLDKNNGTFEGTLELTGNSAFSTSNGYSDKYNKIGELAGTGSMTFTGSPQQAYVFKMATNFTGSITLNAQTDWNAPGHPMRGRRIVFGDITPTDSTPSRETHSAAISLIAGAEASIGANATWNAHNGVELAGSLAIKGSDATLKCDSSATTGLVLDDGASLRFDSSDARLTFDMPLKFTNGVVGISYPAGVTPDEGTILAWPEASTVSGAFKLVGSATNDFTITSGATGLAISRKPPDRLDITGYSYILSDDVSEFLETAGYDDYSGQTWQEYLCDNTAYYNGYTYLQNFLLGYESEGYKYGEGPQKFTASIRFDDAGNIVITTTEGTVPAIRGLVKRIYSKDSLDKQWSIQTVPFTADKKTTIPTPSAGKGFYKVEIGFE